MKINESKEVKPHIISRDEKNNFWQNTTSIPDENPQQTE